jgi:hypothetical protein
MSELLRCANCLAPLRLDAGPIVTCSYCRAQTRVDAPTVVEKPSVASGRRLADTIAFVTSSMHKIPFLEKSAPLPIFRTETLSTSRDDQDVLDVKLVQGERLLASFPFPIRKRAPRGVPKIALTVRVAESGAMSLTLVEPGTDNALDRDGIDVMVAS